MVLPWPGQGLSLLLCLGRMICEHAENVSRVAGVLFVYLLAALYSRQETFSKRNFDRARLQGPVWSFFSSQVCPLMGENVRGLLISFSEILFSQSQEVNSRSLTIKKSFLVSVNLCIYKGREQQDFTSLSRLKVVMQDDGSLGPSCAASCRKLGDYQK